MTTFTYNLDNGSIATHLQQENGMHIVELRDSNGEFDGAATCLTTAEVQKWISERDECKESREEYSIEYLDCFMRG